MKTNALPLLIVFLGILSCGKVNKENENVKNDESKAEQIALVKADNCLTLKNYRKCTTNAERAQWLRDYCAAVCEDTLDIALKKAHYINPDDAPTSLPNTYKITWEDMSAFIDKNMYNAYLSFEYNDAKTIVTGIKLIPKFSDQIVCYSVPLIRYIAKENRLDPKDNFEFGKATVNSNSTVVIKVHGGSYYDFSNEPKSAKNKSIPL